MVEHMVNKIRAHEDMLFHKGGVCDIYENSGFHVILVILAI